ncbi:MAG: response regulator [Candidatus Eisenbacteria bacterium]|nr:response regulator [Candidatus Eisenbacteria bacterium]
MSPRERDRTAPRASVLLVDDDPEFCANLSALFPDDVTVTTCSSPAEATGTCAALQPNLVLLDLDLGRGWSGLDLLLELRQSDHAPPVIMLTVDDSVASAVEAMRRGAYHYVTKPPRMEELLALLERVQTEERLRRRVASLEEDLSALYGGLVLESQPMQLLMRRAERAAPSDATVLLTGESGTGKSLIARRIHALSARRDAPFVEVSCPEFPENLIESELFGHVRGAFTGAIERRLGRFELADGGTLFLDEFGDCPLSLQSKLLRVLDDGRFARVGSSRDLSCDVRLIAATSKDVEALMQRGDLREELYYRVNVFRLHLPPLRDRSADIVPLALHFAAQFARKMKKRIRGFTPAAQAVLLRHAWPGNIRELRNAIERAVIGCDASQLDITDFGGLGSTTGHAVRSQLSYDEAKSHVLASFKYDYLTTQLKAAGGNISVAARRSGLKRQSFQRMLQECAIDPQDFRTHPQESALT